MPLNKEMKLVFFFILILVDFLISNHAEYSFIAITPSSTLARRDST